MRRKSILIAYRMLRKHPGYAMINVAGLAGAMAVCLLVGIYIHEEWRVDRFHEAGERLVQVGASSGFLGSSTITPYPLGSMLANDVAGIEASARTSRRRISVTLGPDEDPVQLDVLLTEPAFFGMFSFPIVESRGRHPLVSLDEIVLSEAVAAQLFGDHAALGESVETPWGEKTVSAVVDSRPGRSTLRFDALLPMEILPESQRGEDSWGAYQYGTYALLRPEVAVESVEQAIARAAAPHFESDPPRFFLRPLAEIYLSDLHTASGFRGEPRYLFIFGGAALLLLLASAANYVNLSTVQHRGRAREIGVRQTMGASRGQLAGQFLGEAILLSSFALAFALVLAWVVMPAFVNVFDLDLSLSAASHGYLIAGLCVFALSVGVGAGTYPAFILSRTRAIDAFRIQNASTSRRSTPYKVLVVFQFAVSAFLVLAVLAVAQQINYMRSKDLGFRGDQLIAVDLPVADPWDMGEQIARSASGHPGVSLASVTTGVPGRFGVMVMLDPEEITPSARTEEERITIRPGRVSEDYFELFDIRLVAGRTFSREIESDRQRSYILNVSAARALGWAPSEAIGMPLDLNRSGEAFGEVIGVVEDFHVESLHRAIPPISLQMFEGSGWSYTPELVARLTDDIPGAVDHLRDVALSFAPDAQFRYRFLDEEFDAMYRSEERLGRIFGAFAVVAILIACMGLFALAAFATQARTKEIGIRKVLGAGVGSVLSLISKEFSLLVLIAMVISFPIGYYAAERWLSDFAYRIDLGVDLFATTALIALLTSAGAVGYHALRAAKRDPVEALRTE